MSARYDFTSYLDKSSSLPLYKQLQRSIRSAIDDHSFTPGDALPPERSLAEGMNISRITVRKAIDNLVSEGLLERRQGSGTFIANRIERGFTDVRSFTEDLADRGFDARSTWLSITEDTIDTAEARELGIPQGSHVYRLRRIRYADEKPLAIQDSIVPTNCIEDIDNIGESLYDALAKTGSRPYRGHQRLRAILFSAEQESLLQIDTKVPGLFIERRSYSVNNRLVELTKSYYRGDAYELVSDIRV